MCLCRHTSNVSIYVRTLTREVAVYGDGGEVKSTHAHVCQSLHNIMHKPYVCMCV